MQPKNFASNIRLTLPALNVTRYTGPARITYSGKQPLAAQYIPEGRKYLGMLLATGGNILHLKRRLSNKDGVIFTVSMVAQQYHLDIDVRQFKKDERKYATIMYYFDTVADVLRGIDMDTGVQVAEITGFTSMGVMALHPNNKWLFCSANVSAAFYANVVVDLGLLTANAFAGPVLATASRPNNRAASPKMRRISPDGTRLVTGYNVTAHPTTSTVIEGFGVLCVFDLTVQPSGLPLYSMVNVIERGRANGRQLQPITFINNTEYLVKLNSDSNAAVFPLPPAALEIIYDRLRRISVAGVNNGYIDYGSGEYLGGFWPGNETRVIRYKAAHAYAVFNYSSANSPGGAPYKVPTNYDVNVVNISAGVTAVTGLNIVPVSGGYPITQGAVIPRYSDELVTFQANNTVRRVSVAAPTAPLLTATGTITFTAGLVKSCYCEVGPKIDVPESEDNRVFVSYELTATGYVMLIFKPEALTNFANSATITPYKAISMPGFSGADESVVIKRVKRY